MVGIWRLDLRGLRLKPEEAGNPDFRVGTTAMSNISSLITVPKIVIIEDIFKASSMLIFFLKAPLLHQVLELAASSVDAAVGAQGPLAGKKGCWQ